MHRVIVGLSLVLTLALSDWTEPAEKYPSRPITIIVGYTPGGATDLAARTVAMHMEKTLGQPIVIENRPGGNGAVGTIAVFKAAPDGYTLGMTSGSILTVMPFTVDLGFDPLQLSFFGSTHESLHVQLVRGDSPWKTIQEMATFAKANPGKLVHSTSGGFGINDIGMALLAKASGGFEYRTLPTGGGAEAVLKILSGDAQTGMNSAAPSLPHIRSGAVRALMILTPTWPELEKMKVPLSKDAYGFTVRNLSAMVGPPALPEEIRRRLEDALKKAMEDKEVMERLKTIGEFSVFKTGEQIKNDVRQVLAEYRAIGEQLGKVLKK
jgi:tripartite-type tricarboxylate transporter receptor subunit TctC